LIAEASSQRCSSCSKRLPSCRIFTFPSAFHPALRRATSLLLLHLSPAQIKLFGSTTTSATELYNMCFSCGCWPWEVHVADAPTKDEYIFLDRNHTFYPDHRVVSEDSLPAFPRLLPTHSFSEHNISHMGLTRNYPQPKLSPTATSLPSWNQNAYLLRLWRAQSFSAPRSKHGALGEPQ
jgi:hypothetical protein